MRYFDSTQHATHALLWLGPREGWWVFFLKYKTKSSFACMFKLTDKRLAYSRSQKPPFVTKSPFLLPSSNPLFGK